MSPLSIDGLRAAAISKAGTDEFGDEWFLEPLEILVKSLNEEARLSEQGRYLTQRRLTSLLTDRLRLRRLQREHPEVRDIDVTVGAVILGLPRTGSTLLHRLLSASPQLTSVLTWECSYPLPFPGESPEGELRQQRVRVAYEQARAQDPAFEQIHQSSWDAPEEEVLLLDRTFTSMSFDSFYWVPSYGTWLRSFDQAPAYKELLEWLQVLQWQRPSREGKRWVLKSPHHLTAVSTVLDAFPSSKVIMTHRSPAEAVPSYASMVRSMSAQYSDQVDDAAIGRYWRDRFVDSLRQFEQVRAAQPERFVDVPYRTAVTAPRDVAARVMSELGLPVHEADQQAFDDYLERNAQERHGSHRYSPEDFGLSTDGLREAFDFYETALERL